MKVEIKRKEEKKERPFPKLMILEDKHGTSVIRATGTCENGYKGIMLHTTFDIKTCVFKPLTNKEYFSSDYKDFEGELILSND